MAKKAKKRGKVKVKSKKRNSENKSALSFIRLEFALNLIASLILLISGIVYLFVPIQVAYWTSFEKILIFEIMNIIIGLGMLVSKLTLKTNPREASVFILVFSILALIFPPYGFVVGPIIGLIGSIMILAKLRRR